MVTSSGGDTAVAADAVLGELPPAAGGADDTDSMFGELPSIHRWWWRTRKISEMHAGVVSLREVREGRVAAWRTLAIPRLTPRP